MTLADYLKHNDLTATEFAARMGVGKSAVSKWLKGQRVPDQGSMAAIIAATRGDVTPNDFFQIPKRRRAA